MREEKGGVKWRVKRDRHGKEEMKKGERGRKEKKQREGEDTWSCHKSLY